MEEFVSEDKVFQAVVFAVDGLDIGVSEGVSAAEFVGDVLSRDEGGEFVEGFCEVNFGGDDRVEPSFYYVPDSWF